MQRVPTRLGSRAQASLPYDRRRGFSSVLPAQSWPGGRKALTEPDELTSA